MEYWQLKEYEKWITKDNELLEKQSYLLSICDKGVLAKFEFKIASKKTEKHGAERTPLNNRLYVFLFHMIKNHITNATRYEKY